MITIARGLKSHQIHGSGTEGDNLYSAFRKLRLEMLTNYAKPWDTTELCKTVSLEKSQFYSCYQKFFQSTPHADLLQIRMDKAKNLLTNEALTVQQIAQMCGFQIFPISADISGNRQDALPCNGAGKWESAIDT